jgi:diacylglycerol kinase (ATP)
VKARLIVNPVAGRDAAPTFLTLLNSRLRARFGAMDLVLTIGAGDAAQAAAEAAQLGCTHIFVAGGDGTVNEAVSGAASVEGALGRITFGILPLGTGNDFATGLGLPPGLEESLDALLLERELAVDVGVLNGHHFVNVSAGGFIAEVSEAVNPQLKSLAGRFAYLIGGAQALLESQPVSSRIHMETREGAKELQIDLLTFAVCNSRMIGGGHLIAPEALINDGWLDVCLVHAMPRSEFVQLLPGVSRGEHLEHEHVEYFCARAITFDFDRPIKVNTDGEVLEASRCVYRVLPQAVRFLSGAEPMALLSPQS